MSLRAQDTLIVSEVSLRSRAQMVVRDVFARHEHADAKDVRAALRNAYPFAARRGHAYRVWLEEVRRECARARVPWRRPSAPREQLKLISV